MLLGSTGDQFQRNAEGSQIWSIFKPAIQSYLYERQQKKFNLAKVKSLVCSPATTTQQMILFPEKTFNRHQQICFFFKQHKNSIELAKFIKVCKKGDQKLKTYTKKRFNCWKEVWRPWKKVTPAVLACWRHILGVIKIPSDTEVAPRYKLSSLLTLEHLRCEWCQRSISSWCLCLILFWHSWRRNSAKKYVHQLVFQVAHSTGCPRKNTLIKFLD